MPGLLSVDPGINSTGWAYWIHRSNGIEQSPYRVGLVRSKRTGSWWEHAKTQVWELESIVQSHSIPMREVDFVCEMPQSMMGSHGGMVSLQTNSIQKLSAMVGMFAYWAWCQEVLSVQLVHPREWKGQLPKAVVCQRIRKTLGSHHCKFYKADIWDAVGIGLHAKGVFK